jgi:hypothetical protein
VLGVIGLARAQASFSNVVALTRTFLRQRTAE